MAPRLAKNFSACVDAGDRVAGKDNLGVEDFGQALDLLDVENGVALHVGDFALDILAGLVVVLGARDGVGIDHERAFLALADMARQTRWPAGTSSRWEPQILAQGRHPERQDIDSGVGLAVMAQRPGDASGGVLGVPRPYPGADAFLKVPDDLGGDAAVNVFSFGRVLSLSSPLKTTFFFAKPATVRRRSAARTCQGRGFSAFIADP